MKKQILLVLSLFSAALTTYAAPALEVCGKRIYEFRTANVKDQKLIQMVDGGVTGKCFRVTCPADRKSLYCHTWSPAMVPIKDSGEMVKVTISLKGKGKGTFGFSPRDAKKIGFGIPGMARNYAIDSKDKWVTMELLFTPNKLYKEKGKFIFPFLTLSAGDELLVDDFYLEFLPAKK